MEKMIGNYQLERELGSGGFGRVFMGHHSILTERMVAVKVLHSHVSSPEEHEQFLQEARFLEHLKHPHILHIFDVGVDQEGFPYLVSAYASGGSLRDLLKQHAPGPLLEDLAVSIIEQIGEALQYAHQQQVIHRDIKPENILFDDGKAFLADFGIAVTLKTASVKAVSIMGTPPYMAPEQFQGIVCKESDQYGLGCIAYELVTGRQPFAAPDFFAMGFQHLSAQPIPPRQLNPALSPSVERAILKAMNKQRSDRHADVGAFLTALKLETNAQADTFPVLQSIAPVEQTATLLPTHIATFPPPSNEDILLTLPSSGHAALKPQVPPLPFFPTPSTPLRQQGPATPFPTSSWTQSGESTKRSDQSNFTAAAFPFTDRPFEIPGTPPETERKRGWRRTSLITVISAALVASLVGVLLFVALSHAAGSTQPGKRGALSTTVTSVAGGKTQTPVVHTTSGVKTIATTSGIPLTNPGATTTPVLSSSPSSGTTVTQGPTATPNSTTGTDPTPTDTPNPTPTPTDTPNPTPTDTPTSPPAVVTETVTANFTGGQYAIQTVNSYSGKVTIAVSGVGQAYNVSCYSDAFYVYTDQQGNAITPFHRTSTPNWVMTINGQHTDAFVSLPSYNANHDYSFTITAPGGRLSFGVDDNVTSDDTGAYTVTVTQG